MKRFRVKVVGLGLALTAGTVVAADGDWRAPGAPPAEVIQAGAPGLLPPAMRAPVGSKGDPAPIWLPARQPGAGVVPAGALEPAPVPPITVPAPQPQPQPQPQPPAPVPDEQSVLPGPRGNGGAGPFPVIPPVPDAAEPPAPPAPPAFTARQPDPVPVPAPRPVEGPPMMVPPRAPEHLPQWKGDPVPVPQPKSDPLPTPRPLEMEPPAGAPAPAPAPELQTAPAGLLVPTLGETVGGKHSTFGSPPLRLSRDYPPLRDLIRQGHDHSDVTIAGDESGSVANRFFVRGEYLLWWVPGFATPVLATTNADTTLNGYLGEPGTTSILGPGSFLGSTRSGFRIRAGAWLDDSGSCGIDTGFFFLPNQSRSVALPASQFPLITRPAFVPNLIPGTNTPLGENGEAVAIPGILNGTLSARGTSELWGADVNLRKSLCTRCDVRAEVFAGYRFLSLRESLAVTEDITVVGSGGARINTTDPIGTHVVVQDSFATRNYFNGGQIGGLYERRLGRWQWDARASVALGATHQVLEIDGFQVRQQPGAAPMTFRGGLLAAGPNLGQFTRDKFSVVPELTLNVGYWVTPNVRLFAGYNFLLWTNVIRPGDQIDHTVDLTFVPNALPAGFSGQYRPRPLFKQSDLVVNGVQFGLDWRW